MTTKKKVPSLHKELGISSLRAKELTLQVAKLFIKHKTHSAMLQELVCDHDIDTKELVFASFIVGSLKEDPKMIVNLLMLETAVNMGLTDFDKVFDEDEDEE